MRISSLGFRPGREHACCMGATGTPGQHAKSAHSGQRSQTVSVGGHRLTLTHLDKVLYPETGTTKADVLGYYAEIADLLIAHAAHRPATRKRWVHGVGTAEHPEPSFFQKNLDDATPSWVPRRSIQLRPLW